MSHLFRGQRVPMGINSEFRVGKPLSLVIHLFSLVNMFMFNMFLVRRPKCQPN